MEATKLVVKTPHRGTFTLKSTTYYPSELDLDELKELAIAHGVDRRGCSTPASLVKKLGQVTLLTTTKAYNLEFCQSLELNVPKRYTADEVRQVLIDHLKAQLLSVESLTVLDILKPNYDEVSR